MVSGRLTEKNGYFYIVLSYKGPERQAGAEMAGNGAAGKR